MSESSPVPQSAPLLEVTYVPGAAGRARRINQLCDQFEEACRGAQKPVIEEYLGVLERDEQPELLCELVGLEMEIRRQAGEHPELSEYRKRFPDHAAALDSVGKSAPESSSVLENMVSATRWRAAPAAGATPRRPGAGGVKEDELDAYLGTTIAGRYQVHRRLGAGGMGVVYQARQQPLDRWVALKLVHADLARDPLAVKRFQREMKATVRIEHPNTVRVYDYGAGEHGELFLVMEYLDGQTLSEALADGQPFEAERIDHIGLQVAKALAAAQTEGIIHRDLKPQNIVLLDHYGDHDLVKVLDFGLARFTQQPTNDDPSITHDGSLVGTPHYMSPEQIAGEPVDQRSDLYALGVLLYRMATGRELFTGKTVASIVAKHLHELPAKPSSIPGTNVPEWLERLILQLLEKDPARRPQSAEEVILQLDRSRLKVPVPADESARVAALRELRILDTDPEQIFDDLTSLASYICGTPLAAISLVDQDRQWFKARVGGQAGTETSRNISFCTHTILGNELFIVPDASKDSRFAESPLVQNESHLRFYAGMPLITADGHNIGALCVMDRQPRQLTPEQIAALTTLSRLVQAQFELRRNLLALREAVSSQADAKPMS